MKSILNQLFNDVIEPYLAPKVRRGSINAVKTYLSSIKILRGVAITSFQIGTVSGVLVTGLVLIAIGVIGLLPITAQTMLIAMIMIGVVMTATAGYLAWDGSREKRWLEWSKSQALIDAAIGEWDHPLVPPDPRKVMSPQATEAAKNYDENRKLAAKEQIPMRPPLSESVAELPRPV